MALCLEDKESRISDLARLFFHELSQKGNAIYNILPDLISSLSSTADLPDSSFRSIMKYLFSFIEKVTNDLILLSTPIQSNGIAYC